MSSWKWKKTKQKTKENCFREEKDAMVRDRDVEDVCVLGEGKGK